MAFFHASDRCEVLIWPKICIKYDKLQISECWCFINKMSFVHVSCFNSYMHLMKNSPPLVTTKSQFLFSSFLLLLFPARCFIMFLSLKKEKTHTLWGFPLTSVCFLLSRVHLASKICQYVGFKLGWVKMGGWTMNEWPLTSTRQDSGYEPLPWKGSAVQSVRMLSW